MLHKIMSLGLVLGLAALLAACNDAPKASVAVVNTEKVFKECKAGQAAMAHLQEVSKALQAKTQKAQETLEASQSEDNMQAFQQALGEYQATIGAEQQRLVALINDQFNAVVDKLRTDKGFSVVLAREAVMSYDASADITDDVVKAMDAANIDLKLNAAKPAEAAPAAAKPAAEAKPAEAAPAAAAPTAEVKPADAKPADPAKPAEAKKE